VAIDGRNSIGSGTEMSRSFPSHQPLGFGPGEELGLWCGDSGTRSLGIAAKLHEVLEVKKRAQAMYVHCGIRIHALRELNLTRNLEYVLGAPYLPCPEQTMLPRRRFGRRVGISHVT
jgi:hypothetical protein